MWSHNKSEAERRFLSFKLATWIVNKAFKIIKAGQSRAYKVDALEKKGIHSVNWEVIELYAII